MGSLVKAGDLSQRSADKHRTLWLAWRVWLLLRELDWHRVRPVSKIRANSATAVKLNS